MTHYETLGVGPGASADEVKQAFRRKASAAHPDRGGSDADMQAINRAYETLSDPQRRAAYDAGGDGGAVKSLDEEALGMLTSLLRSVIDSGESNLLGKARNVLAIALEQLGQHQATATADRARLVTLRSRVRRRGEGENVMHGLIDAKIADVDQRLPLLARGVAVNERAFQLLEPYEMVAEEPQFSPAAYHQALYLQGLGGGGF